VGVGNPLEAAFVLAGPVKAGNWQLIGDGIVLAAGGVDIRYDVIWRKAGAAAGAGDVTLVSFQNHFVQPTGTAQFDAVAFEGTAAGVAAGAVAGDSLVLRFTAMNSPAGTMAFIPNGDGTNAKGRIPAITLPR
jgi:hypothetical protein